MTNSRFSIVIPAKDEAESLGDLLKEISAALGGDSFEVIVVDDGSTDGTAGVLQRLAEVHPFLRCLVHAQCCGKSAAILTGVRAARAPLIATLDGDGQNDPCYLPALLALMAEPGVGLAAGQRIKHAHPQAKRIGSRFANRLRARLLHDNTRDTACGLKAFRGTSFCASHISTRCIGSCQPWSNVMDLPSATSTLSTEIGCMADRNTASSIVRSWDCSIWSEFIG